VSDNTDCDDGDASVHEPQLYYVDADGDGYGSTTTTMLCESVAPNGYSDNNTDCDDGDASVHEPQLYYVDADGDGYGSTATAMLCESVAPSGYSDNNTDCDDGDINVHPGAEEVLDNDKDDDCNGFIDDGALGEEALELDVIKVLPNPFNTNLIIELPTRYNSQNFEIFLFDLNGRLIIEHNLISVNGIITVNHLETLQQGMYLLKVSTALDNRKLIKRVVKF
ncbi:MopE-related protein, partial [Snuella lapsa]|uniref:MopE-related protein n=1 Tax=Snuella lapsa TaxID=870481 RepID=UPI0031ED75C9